MAFPVGHAHAVSPAPLGPHLRNLAEEGMG
jgi:hypothetical protein